MIFGRIGPLKTRNQDELKSFPSLLDFEVTARIERRYSTRYTLRKGPLVVKIDAIDGVAKEAADRLAEEGRVGILALYGNALSPYPGDITRKIAPNTKYQPTYVRRPEGSGSYMYFLLFANDRLGYGAATADTVKYRSLLGWLYLERLETSYKVRIFAPLDHSWKDLQELFLALEAG